LEDLLGGPRDAGRGQVQQFRHGLQIPIRVIHVHVAEIGGQLGQLAFDILSGAIPRDERRRRKAMTIMPRAA
jgi:hypothetical protein